jgi:hypothetical protein
MAMDITGIFNENEFYTHHYLSAILENDLKDIFSQWKQKEDEQAIPQPWTKLRGLRKEFFNRLSSLERQRDVKERINIQQAFTSQLLSVLGYEYHCQTIELDDTGSIPLAGAINRPDGTPELWIIEVVNVEEEDADPLELNFLRQQYLEDEDLQKILNISTEEIITRHVFARPEPPRWVILVSFSQMILIDRTKWNEKRLLRFHVREILDRRETSTLQAMAALLHRDSICPKVRISPLRSHLFDPGKTPFLNRVKIRNSVFQQIIRLMSLTRPKKGKNNRRGRISYAQLGINQLGAVYEALLSYQGFFAETDLYEVKKAGENYNVLDTAYFVKPGDIGQYTDDERVFNEDGTLVKYQKSTFIYRLAGRDREKSASYYTPEVLTQCLVKYALKVKMYIADNNVHGVDLNPVAVELAEVSLWLNTIYEGGFVPWFGMQLVCGNSLVGARRQVFHESLLAKKNKTDPLWTDTVPERVMPGEKRKPDTIYHFLLPDKAMADYRDKVIKQMAGDEIKAINEWRKEFTRPFSKSETEQLKKLSAAIDKLWKKHTEIQRLIDARTTDPLYVFGQSVPEKQPPLTTTEFKDRIFHQEMFSKNVRDSSPYRRLKLVMDYWCSLWFWPIQQADLLPSRAEFLFDLTLILEGNLFDANVDENGQQLLFPDTRPKQLSLNMLNELGHVDVDRLCRENKRLAWFAGLWKNIGICTGNWSLPICLRPGAALTWCWEIRHGSRWNGMKAGCSAMQSLCLCCET